LYSTGVVEVEKIGLCLFLLVFIFVGARGLYEGGNSRANKGSHKCAVQVGCGLFRHSSLEGGRGNTITRMQQYNEQFCDCGLVCGGFSKGVFGQFLCDLSRFPGAWYSVPAFPAIVVREYLRVSWVGTLPFVEFR
jgi:hypothetical protein